MGDHTYKKIVAGNYVRSDGVEILKHDAGGWRVYLPLPAAGGQQMIGIRPTLRQAKEAAEHHMRLAVDSAHAHAISEYFDRELAATAAARSAEGSDDTAKYDSLQRELTQGVMTAQEKDGGLLRIEVSAEIAALLSSPFGAKPRWTGLRFGGHDVIPRLELAPEAWRITPSAGWPVLAANPSAASPRAILRSVLAVLDAHETASGMPLDYPAAVNAVREVAADLGVEL